MWRKKISDHIRSYLVFRPLLNHSLAGHIRPYWVLRPLFVYLVIKDYIFDDFNHQQCCHLSGKKTEVISFPSNDPRIWECRLSIWIRARATSIALSLQRILFQDEKFEKSLIFAFYQQPWTAQQANCLTSAPGLMWSPQSGTMSHPALGRLSSKIW